MDVVAVMGGEGCSSGNDDGIADAAGAGADEDGSG
jgi:hypothetical protein